MLMISNILAFFNTNREEQHRQGSCFGRTNPLIAEPHSGTAIRLFRGYRIKTVAEGINRDSVGSHEHRGIELQVIAKREGARGWKG